MQRCAHVSSEHTQEKGVLMQGIYTKRPGAAPCLTLLGPVIAETPAQPDLVNDATSHAREQAQPSAAVQTPIAGSGIIASTLSEKPASPAEQSPEPVAAADSDTQAARPIGPEFSPQIQASIDAQSDQPDMSGPAMPGSLEDAAGRPKTSSAEYNDVGLLGEENGGTDERDEQPKRRVVGPAMPSAELLAAAAEVRQAVRWDSSSEPLHSYVSRFGNHHCISRVSGGFKIAMTVSY